MNKYKTLSVALMVMLSQQTLAATVKTFKNNAELSVELSNTNQNRLMVSNDKIIKAAFPDGALTYQYDETDGSMYVHPEISAPFTLFLSTKKGQHLSLTVNSVDSLGKTIAFKQYRPQPIKRPTSIVKKEAPYKKEALEMVKYMEQGIKMPGASVSHVRYQAGQFKNGLRLIKREIWQDGAYKGEVFDVYNNSKRRIKLDPIWFAEKLVKAIKLSKMTLAPKDKTNLYLITEVSHG